MLYLTLSIGIIIGMTITEQLAQAILRSNVSRYRIYKDTGVSQVILHRIVKGYAGCSMETLTTLCDYLNLELKPKNKKEGK